MGYCNNKKITEKITITIPCLPISLRPLSLCALVKVQYNISCNHTQPYESSFYGDIMCKLLITKRMYGSMFSVMLYCAFDLLTQRERSQMMYDNFEGLALVAEKDRKRGREGERDIYT